MRQHTLHKIAVLTVLFFLSVNIIGKVYKVVPDGINLTDPNAALSGNFWKKTDASGQQIRDTEVWHFSDALTKAVAGDEVWLLGAWRLTKRSEVYVAPKGGWTIPSGVKIYGGFQGTEKSVDERITQGQTFSFVHRSVLSGDLNFNDVVDPDNLIFPENTTRSDNATHLLIIDASNTNNTGNFRTVVNGLSLMGGNAYGTSVAGGGAVYVKGGAQCVSYTIERCFMINNYGVKGGAIYVDASVKSTNSASLINQCVVFNNVAGTEFSLINEGGGVYLAGAGKLTNSVIYNNVNGGVVLSNDAFMVNCNSIHNSAAGVDMMDNTSGQTQHVINSVVWGNSSVVTSGKSVNFCYSAFPGAEENNQTHNINLSVNNLGSDTSPLFETPSPKLSYDIEFDWTHMAYPLWSWKLQDGSFLKGKGNSDLYKYHAKDDNGLIGADLGESNRLGGPEGTIDIGAYEFKAIPQSRIRFVTQQGGAGLQDGKSWNTAYSDVQKAINDLATNALNEPGEVWIAAGNYTPTGYLNGEGTPISFRMRDGVSVFGGFAGTEHSKDERQHKPGGMPWEYTNVTRLMGSSYDVTRGATWDPGNYEWNVYSKSSHVVWFAPLPDEAHIPFRIPTMLEGVTIEGGKSSVASGTNKYKEDCGAGIYLSGNKCYLHYSIVRNNAASNKGGGVYLEDGRVRGCLIYNNTAKTQGGGIFLNRSGLILRSMITNNSAIEGGGAYLDNNQMQGDGKFHPEYQLLSTSVVTNNTSVRNGAVYCNKGGVVLHTLIAKNNTPTDTDLAAQVVSRTGGLYINEYTKLINSVLWRNEISGRQVQLYANNPDRKKVTFFNNGVSNTNNILWNNTYQQDMIEISETNQSTIEKVLDPGFKPEGMPSVCGVLPQVKEVTYYWEPISGSNLRARGLHLASLPKEVMLMPELDITGKKYDQKPALGPYRVQATPLRPEITADHIRLYVDEHCTEETHDGSHWRTAYRSLNEAVAYMADLTAAEVGNRRLEIYVAEGDIWPRYASVNEDPKSTSLIIRRMLSGKKLFLKGGFCLSDTTKNDPLLYRSQINANHRGKRFEDGLYHAIIVAEGVDVELQGFHVINGNALTGSTLKAGGGMLVRDHSKVTLRNCIFENNRANENAAIDARGSVLFLYNCVFNNNANLLPGKTILAAKELNCYHSTLVHNVGLVPTNQGTRKNAFSVGNVDVDGTAGTQAGNSHDFAVRLTNFANPTRKPGATLGYDTYLGGYSSFMLTTQCPVVNQGQSDTGMNTDITGNPRSRGGAPDLGAYEALLPIDGTVIYVRENGTGDGSTWDKAMGSIGGALAKATVGQEIWVAAGTYIENLTMKDGVNVLGGFAKTGNPENDLDTKNRDISHRNPNFRTVIQGQPQYHFQPNNAYPGTFSEFVQQNKRVVTQAQNFTHKTTWEGLVITGGQTGLDEYGAGVKLMTNGHLKNCRIENNRFYECGKVLEQERKEVQSIFGRPIWRWVDVRTIDHTVHNHTGGGGVFCAGGIVENCQIIQNIVDGFSINFSKNDRRLVTQAQRLGGAKSIIGKGAGLSIASGNIINCVIAKNVCGYDVTQNPNPINDLTNVFGSGVYVQSASSFYSCTIVENCGGWVAKDRPIVPGVWDESMATGNGSNFYNCIIIGNYGYGSTKENLMQIGKGLTVTPKNLMYSYTSLVTFPDGSSTPSNDAFMANRHNIKADFGALDIQGQDAYIQKYKALKLFNEDFTLNVHGVDNLCVNSGGEEFLVDVNKGIDIHQDADGYERVQYCTVDMGAYENRDAIAISPDANGVFYVTPSGRGKANASSLENASCAQELQQVLDVAGEYAKTSTKQVIVKLAGDPHFVYRPTKMTDNKDLKSFSFVVPYGVTVMGGYDATAANWDGDRRNAFMNPTVLSGIAQVRGTSINGYHVLTFAEKPVDWPTTNTGKQTIVDGLYIKEGAATAMIAGLHPNTRGGAAVVPEWAHVRNCVITDCSAIYGGALYLLPGATVSGTLMRFNEAEYGGAVYADSTHVTPDTRAHMISVTITDNVATAAGGGIFMQEASVMVGNSTFWGNQAPSDKNISGVVTLEFKDTKFSQIQPNEAEFYPFNDCFIETYKVPSDKGMRNTEIESDSTLYFKDDRTLKAYSTLIKSGAKTPYYEQFENIFHLAAYDMKNEVRREPGHEYVDVGAFAFSGGKLPVPDAQKMFHHLFVSQATNKVIDGQVDQFLGRSFHTAITWLDDALEYIKKARKVPGHGNDVFHIYLAQGTYRPNLRRLDEGKDLYDQRQCSFVIPSGVKIYGGFAGNENYGCGISSLTEIRQDGTKHHIALQDVTQPGIQESFVNGRVYEDLNNNGVKEPWELNNQSILSGDLNSAITVKNAYHVVFSSTKNIDYNSKVAGAYVLLDGLTVKDGEGYYEMTLPEAYNETGRGAGLYTNGIDYKLNGCRIMNCVALRGAAVYCRDANLTVVGSDFIGNSTVQPEDLMQGKDSRGGAVYMSAFGKDVRIALRSINTLWANNETNGYGGAVATSNDLGYAGVVQVDIMNNLFVRNKALLGATAVYATGKNTLSGGTLTNSVMWGGDGHSSVVSEGLTISYCASDAVLTGSQNVLLNKKNMAVDGPKFTTPTERAGVIKSNVVAKWNPIAVSVLTDAGWGELPYQDANEDRATGVYQDWWKAGGNDLPRQYFPVQTYKRYRGPIQLNDAAPKDPDRIDIGLYEYQFKDNFRSMNVIYVDTRDHGTASGENWDNATSDLRGAIAALCYPDNMDNKHKTIYVRSGEYQQTRLFGGYAYPITMDGTSIALESLTLYGSCTGITHEQNYKEPTILSVHQDVPNTQMISVRTNGKKFTLDGFLIRGVKAGTSDLHKGIAIDIHNDNRGMVLLNHLLLRKNAINLHAQNNTGATMLIANTLFADGQNGIIADGEAQATRVINNTFANLASGITGNAPVAVCNTVSWKVNAQAVPTDNQNGNVDLGQVENHDIYQGPNFVAPAEGNYMIRPSFKLLDAANATKYTEWMGVNALTTDKDLGNHRRMTGTSLDIGAYEYDAPLQQIVFVKTNVAQTDQSGKDWTNPIRDLQTAIDLASVYAVKNKQPAYVFAHKDVRYPSTINMVIPNVKVYGGMFDETGNNATELIAKRKSVLQNQMSTVNGLMLDAENSVLDGFKIQGTAEVRKGLLATSVIEGAATVSTPGTVYNSFARNTLKGTGTAVNVTSLQAVTAAQKQNVIENATENGYVTEDIWKYQLKETNPNINNQQAIAVDQYITMVGHDRDLSGMPRVRDGVDYGCFETFDIKNNTMLTKDAMPTSKHVVYVRKGNELSIGKGLFRAGEHFDLGFLLLEHGAGFRSNANSVSLTNFAVERNLDTQNNHWDLVYMPFAITKTEGAEQVTASKYDGEVRANFDYQFIPDNDMAWIPAPALVGMEGLLLQSAQDAKVRMYGNVYEETANHTKNVVLMQHNHMEPWNSGTTSSQKFTHLENMGWNMFGSPFLCAMNDADMEYGRVIYEKKGNTFVPRNTIDPQTTQGSIGACSAVLTQTATLENSEVVKVKQRVDDQQTQPSPAPQLRIALSSNNGDEQDWLFLNAVATDESKTDFDMATDGVKMMTVGDAAQLYLERSGKQYALLSALDRVEKVDMGVYTPTTGTYSLGIPKDCDVTDYEVVMLHDKQNGRVVDLLEGTYQFTGNATDTCGTRFALSFVPMQQSKMNQRIYVHTLGNGQVRIGGLQQGDVVTAYQENGVRVAQLYASSLEEHLSLPGKIALILVKSAHGEELVKKVVIR